MTIRRSKKQKHYTHNRGFKGKTTKLSFTKFVYYLFEINEAEPPNGVRLTDEDIIESAIAEFGRGPLSVKYLADPHSSGSVATMRAKYNGTLPSLLSIRYDDKQRPCKNYQNPLSIDAIRIRAFKYKIIDPRLFTLDEIKKFLILQEETLHPNIYDEFSVPNKQLIMDYPFGSIAFDNPEPEYSLYEVEMHANKSR